MSFPSSIHCRIFVVTSLKLMLLLYPKFSVRDLSCLCRQKFEKLQILEETGKSFFCRQKILCFASLGSLKPFLTTFSTSTHSTLSLTPCKDIKKCLCSMKAGRENSSLMRAYGFFDINLNYDNLDQPSQAIICSLDVKGKRGKHHKIKTKFSATMANLMSTLQNTLFLLSQ